MTTNQTIKNPFVRTTDKAEAIVLFWVERIEHVNIGKRAAKQYLKNQLGDKEGDIAYDRGYILCDTVADAKAVAEELRRVTDCSVGQFVFGAKIYVAPNTDTLK
jgi:hypothetical protein